MKKTIAIVVLSLLVLSMGYVFGKVFIYNVGYQAGYSNANQEFTAQLNKAVADGQIIIPSIDK